MKTTRNRPFRVWVEQVNEMMIEVEAASGDEALCKAERQWRRHTSPRVGYAEVDANRDGRFTQVFPLRGT